MEFQSAASLQHINVRKEGPGDEKVTAIDLKFECILPADFVDSLVCPVDETAGEALSSFWTESGDAKFATLEHVRFSRQIFNMTVVAFGLEMTSCKLSKWSFKAMDMRQAEVAFSVSTTSFPANTLSVLGEQLGEVGTVRAFAAQQDMFEDGAAPDINQDELFENALSLCKRDQKVSISHLQRCLGIGYNRAARLVEEMERRKLCSPMDASGARRLLV